MKNFLWLTVFLSFLLGIESLKVLIVVNIVGKSHLDFSSNLVDVLAQRGHIVDYVLLRLNDVVELLVLIFGVLGYWMSKMPHLKDFFEKSPRTLFDLPHYYDMAYRACKLSMEDGRMLKYIKEGNYDIAITSDYDFYATTLLRAAGIRSVASFSPTPIFPHHLVSAGIPSPASVFAGPMAGDHDGSLFDRVFHLLRSALYLYVDRPKQAREMNALARKHFGEDFPDVEEISRDVNVIFVNSNEIIDKARPISHKVKFIGGIQMQRPKPLPKEIEALLDLSSRGTVIFSFGTQVPTTRIPLEIRRNFVRAFRKFPDVTFLWKYDRMDDDFQLFENATNVHKLEWLPQTTLLQDKRVIGFISHAGQNSYVETAAAGIPIIAIPLIVDQFYNARNAVDKGIGILIDKEELNESNLVVALDQLLNNPSYRQNATRLARMIRQKPDDPKEHFIEWVEYAAKNPAIHEVFNLPGNDMGPFKYYCVDVILFLIFSLFLTVFVSWKLFSLVSVIANTRIRITKKEKLT
ncbi:unnamed protein product [Caenorhabditis auriculariae]|uniref:UDP-glucuronosyltransferase n=1 Tax=Caenorhabditis auriculariae TaxID=2777116 RepID=A0A8S1H9G0_9PELO|nr:unnamed protein product [Caenorhabditis auriculariae]